jgi:polysaccharide deacetylase 2 family uncharacterized protein YibQ
VADPADAAGSEEDGEDAEGGSDAPADSIPLPSGSEFNRPPPEEEAVLPEVDTAPGTATPDAPPLPLQTFSGGIDTDPAPQPDIAAPPAAPTPAAPGAGMISRPGGGGDASPSATEMQPGQVPVPEPDAAASPDASSAPPPRNGILEAQAGAGTETGTAPAGGVGATDEVRAMPEPGAALADPERSPTPEERVEEDAPAGQDASDASASLAEGTETQTPEADDTAPGAPPNALAQLLPSQSAAPPGLERGGDIAVPDMSQEGAPGMPPSRPRFLNPGADGDVGRRLPQIVSPGRDETIPGMEEPPTFDQDADAPVGGDDPRAEEEAPALVAHAAPFDEGETRPLIGVVLIDTPDSRLDIAALTGFSFPVSFAVDPMRPDAAERAAAFREAGFEVLMLASAIPEGATASDTEVALAAAQSRVPQAIAVLDTPEGRIRSDREVLEATVGVAAGGGLGLLAFPGGLNTAEQMAQRAGVPAETLYRLLDDEDQRATVITRYLGRAEFAAVQEGGVIVAGRVRPDTVTALYSWALGDRDEGVAIAPVSAVLRRLAEDG